MSIVITWANLTALPNLIPFFSSHCFWWHCILVHCLSRVASVNIQNEGKGLKIKVLEDTSEFPHDIFCETKSISNRLEDEIFSLKFQWIILKVIFTLVCLYSFICALSFLASASKLLSGKQVSPQGWEIVEGIFNFGVFRVGRFSAAVHCFKTPFLVSCWVYWLQFWYRDDVHDH